MACLRYKYMMLEPCRNPCWWYGRTSILVLHRFSGILIHGNSFFSTATHLELLIIIRNSIQSLRMNCRCLNLKLFMHISVFFCIGWSHLGPHVKWMHCTDNRTRIFGHSSHKITVIFFIMKEDIDLHIEEKWRKWY